MKVQHLKAADSDTMNRNCCGYYLAYTNQNRGIEA
jgi:hypothetical protein